MSRRCDITGRGPQVGHKVSHAHNVSLRRWEVNLQKVRVLVNGRTMHLRVSTKAIKSGLIVRPPFVPKVRRPKELQPQVVQQATLSQQEAPGGHFFSEASVVSRLFKPKPKVESTGPVVGVDIPDFDTPNPTYGAELGPRPAGQRPERPERHERKGRSRS